MCDYLGLGRGVAVHSDEEGGVKQPWEPVASLEGMEGSAVFPPS
jgi:hypothetical protein